MAAVPQLGRAAGVEHQIAPEAAATQELYERYARQIYGFCLHQLGNREEAEDAVQTTFLNAFRGLRRGISPEAESAWLFKIAHNVCLTRRRSSWRRGRVETPGDMQAVQDFVAAPQRMDTDELIELQEALAGMPANQRKAILLREWRGMSYREIADEMELSQAAVETLIFRARRSLAKGLEEPEQRGVWKRLRQGMDVGSALAVLKTAFAGGVAAKAVATAAAVTSVGLVTAVPGGERAVHRATAAERPAAAAPVVARSGRPRAVSVGQAARDADPVRVRKAKAKPRRSAPKVSVEAPPPVVGPAAPPQAEQPPAPPPVAPTDRGPAPKTEIPKNESKGGASPKPEPAPKADRGTPKEEAPKGGGPKSDTGKPEARKIEAPKVDPRTGEGTRAAPPAAPHAAASAARSEEAVRQISAISSGLGNAENKAEAKQENKGEGTGNGEAKGKKP